MFICIYMYIYIYIFMYVCVSVCVKFYLIFTKNLSGILHIIEKKKSSAKINNFI